MVGSCCAALERLADRGVPHVAALDGIRALAVAAVVLYHLRASFAPGGYAGVPVFFVLSGYLITALLTDRWATHHGLGLRSFWRRRVRRLLPAQVVLVTGVLLASLVVDAPALRRLPAAAATALLQVANWWQVVADEPYFEAADGPAVFAHLWSLAVEAQLYLAWPLVLAFVLRRRSPARWAVAMAWCSYTLMAVLHEPYADPTRSWVGTDVQAGPFLLGAAVALLVPPGHVRAAPGRHAGPLLDAAGTAAVAVVVWFVLAVDDFEPFAYQGGLAAVGVATAVLVLVAVHPGSLVGRVLAVRPLRWLGERSYGLYLWHWPVIAVTREWPWEPAPLALLRVGVSVVAAAASYRLVERRFHAPPPGRATREPRPALPSLLPRLAAVTATAVAVAGLAVVWDARSTPPPVVLASDRVVSVLPVALPITTTSTSTSTTVAAAPVPAPTTTTAPPAPVGIDLAIGDSVLADAGWALLEAVPGITVDAVVGRQLVDAADSVRGWEAKVPLHRVVLSLGTNGPFPPERLDELLAELQDVRRVVLVNVRMPRSWEAEVNAQLAAATGRWPNVVLVDWHAFSHDKTELFARDGIHVNRSGARSLAMLIAAGLATP